MKITRKQVEMHSFIHRGKQFYAWIMEEKDNKNGVTTRGWYIQARNYGIISYCYGLMKDDTKKEKFLEYVERDLHEYAEDYYQEYMLQDDLLRSANR